MAEAASGTIVLQEQDPCFVDDMLRFLYAKSVDISILRDGKDIPLLCVELFRMADFFLISELASIAKAELQRYLVIRMHRQDNDKAAMPETLAEVLDSIRRAYKDNSTGSLRQMLLTFLCMRRDRYLQSRDTIAVIDELPDFGKDLMKTCLSVDLTTSAPNLNELPRALPVLEAVLLNGVQAYAAGGPSQVPISSGLKHCKTPCMLRTRVDHDYPLYPLFEVVDSTTEKTLDNLQWIVPRPRLVSEIYSNSDSSIVQVCYGNRYTDSNRMVQVRLACPADAKHYVGRYRNAVPVDHLKEVEGQVQELEKELNVCRDNLYVKAIGAPCNYE